MGLIRYLILAVLLFLAVYYDVRQYRIKNILVLLTLAGGYLSSFLTGGMKGLLYSLIASAIPAVLLMVLFALRMMGAGDIKVFCSIGAIMGMEFVLYSILFSFLAGGVIGMAIMMTGGNVRKRFAYLAFYLKTIFLTGSLEPYSDFSGEKKGATFHFAPAIAAGCCIQLLVPLLSNSSGFM